MKKQYTHPENFTAVTRLSSLQQLAFNNSVQATIITIASSGKIQFANNAACELLAYSHEEILIKSRANIFDITESRFKSMLKQRSTDGRTQLL